MKRFILDNDGANLVHRLGEDVSLAIADAARELLNNPRIPVYAGVNVTIGHQEARVGCSRSPGTTVREETGNRRVCALPR